MLVDQKDFYYPPGGLLLWMIILLELITFGVALIVMVGFARQDPSLFHQGRMELNITIGTLNTILLLTSGFFMANTVTDLKNDKFRTARRHLFATMMFGLLFLGLKSIEYNAKINAGLLLNTNVFFTFYWMLTLFHALHVMFGLALLIYVHLGLKRDCCSRKMEDIESIAAFWHMCDLIWLLLFPVIYLVF